MCGITAILSKDVSIKKLLNGLKQLQNRGYDSAGICTLKDDFSILKYASNENINAIDKLGDNIYKINESNIGIAHTRWATHGAKTDSNSHPHISSDNKISLVHNGIIENFYELKDKLIYLGYTFKSQTDTEVISNLVAHYYEQTKDIYKAIDTTINQLQGTWGLAILCKDCPNKLFCVRHGSPLLVGKTDDFVMISSEQSGFCGLVNNYIILESNDICEISLESNKIKIETNNKYKPKNLTKNNFDLTPQPYEHWTIKEIEEQVESSFRAISLGGRLLNDDEVKLGGLNDNKQVLSRIDNLILLGCGTSYHAGLLGLEYFKDLCNFNVVMIFDGAEFTKKDIPKVGASAVVLLSQSGETKDLHRCIQIAKDEDLFLIGVINVVDSMIAREVNCGCYLNAGREVAVASTKAFTSQVIILSMMAIWFSQIHKTNINKRKKYVKYLRNLSMDIKNSIDISKKHMDKLIPILNKSNMFILGKGKCEAIAREGSLKIKEISYIHAEGYSGSSLKHGPFALLDKDVPVIMVMPDNEFYVKMENAYHEIQSRHAPLVVITTKTDCIYDNSIILPKNRIYEDLLCIIPLQLFSYHLSLSKGINPDMPRNLAKVVTTE